MKLYIGIFFSALFLLFACKSATPVAETSEGSYFGEEFKIEKTLDVNTVVQQLAENDTLDIQVAGIVESVCKKKGCWTNLAQSSNDTKETLFVKFKDYGFFLPLDCEGQDLILRGKAYIEETSVEELQHYAEDEGKSAEEIAAITEPEKEFKFMASGAFLKNKMEKAH